MFTKESYEVHKLLSHILDNPSISSQDLVKKVFPDKDVSDQIEILSASRNVIEETLNTKLDSGLPKRIHRLRFCWTVLRLADNALRLKKTGDFPVLVTFDYLTELFSDVYSFPVTHAFLLEKILEKLGIETNGMFIKQYSSFLKSSKNPRAVGIQICDREGNLYRKNLSRIIFWIIRKNRYKYVEEDKENGRIIHFTALTDDVVEELKKWCRESDLKLYPDLTEEIENQINLWLEYSCLDGDSLPSNISDQIEIAKSFIKENNLKSKIRIQVVSQDPQEGKKIRELESEISGYIDEISKLEKEINELRKKGAITDKHKESVKETNLSESSSDDIDRDFLEYLKIIDSKYSFDVLRSIQLGEEKSVTMKNFIAHFFYGLRKKGLVPYPADEQFELSYEQSGLYDCVGFEVSPGNIEHVKTEKQGWAIKKGGSLFPVKKAVIKLKD